GQALHDAPCEERDLLEVGHVLDHLAEALLLGGLHHDDGKARAQQELQLVLFALHAASRRAPSRRASSFACTPPKPPLDMTSTWSPGRSIAATDSTIGSISWKTKARAPSGASAPAGSQPRPFA